MILMNPDIRDEESEKKFSRKYKNNESINDDNFLLLVDILKKLEKNKMGGKNIDNSIADIIDSVERYLTAEQRTIILREFVRYMRKERKPSRLDSVRENEKNEYRDSRDFF